MVSMLSPKTNTKPNAAINFLVNRKGKNFIDRLLDYLMILFIHIWRDRSSAISTSKLINKWGLPSLRLKSLLNKPWMNSYNLSFLLTTAHINPICQLNETYNQPDTLLWTLCPMGGTSCLKAFFTSIINLKS